MSVKGAEYYTPEMGSIEQQVLIVCNKARAKAGKRPVKRLKKGSVNVDLRYCLIKASRYNCVTARTVGQCEVFYDYEPQDERVQAINLFSGEKIFTSSEVTKFLARFDRGEVPHLLDRETLKQIKALEGDN